MKYGTSIFHLFNPRSEEHAIALSRAGVTDGADGICLELLDFPPELRTVDVFRRIIAATPVPKIFCDYRNDKFFAADDDARMASLLKAAEAGADYIDVMGDLYDPVSDQLSFDVRAVERQKRTIDDVHSLGSKVLMSSHVLQRSLKSDEAVSFLRAQAERGADVCKLVSMMHTLSDFNEGVMALSALRTGFGRPWIFLGGGVYGRLQRFIGPSFGCAVEFAVHDYEPENPYDQPTIRSFRLAMDALAWQAPKEVEPIREYGCQMERVEERQSFRRSGEVHSEITGVGRLGACAGTVPDGSCCFST